jgi:hypothetical protein
VADPLVSASFRLERYGKSEMQLGICSSVVH